MTSVAERYLAADKAIGQVIGEHVKSWPFEDLRSVHPEHIHVFAEYEQALDDYIAHSVENNHY